MTNPTIEWDPTKLFGIDMARSKCCGKATLNGRRCTRDISLAKEQEIKRLLQKLSRYQPNVAMIDTWLNRLARCLLCEPTHQDQAKTLVDQWKRNLDALIARTRRQYGDYGWGSAMDRTRSQNRELEIEMNRATRRSATAAEATRARDRQIPDLVIRQPVSGPADGTEVARDEGIVNSIGEELALQVKFEEAGIQATATVNHDSPASPAANRIEDTLGNPIIHRPEMVNIPASDNDASANNNRPEAVNILQEAPAPDAGPSLSGVCPICRESIIDRGYLVCCQAYCGRYFHRRCLRRYVRRSGDTRCPYCRVIWIEEEDEETTMVAVIILLASLMVNHVKATARNAIHLLHALYIESQVPWIEALSTIGLVLIFYIFVFFCFLLIPIDYNFT